MIEKIKELIHKLLVILGLVEDYNEKGNSNSPIYFKKSIMTNCELDFYKKIEYFNVDYVVVPQLNLATVINKNGSRYHNELFRNIDFAIFSKNFELLLLIELDDKSHNKINRKDRDLKVKKICNDAKIRLIKFYTIYPNEKNYVVNRIKKELEYIINKKEG